MRLLRTTLVNTIPPAAVLIGGALLVAFLGEAYQMRVAYILFANLVIVVGLQIFMGNANVANLGHITFAGLAAYVVAILHTPAAIKASMIPTAPFGLASVEIGAIPAAAIALALTGVVAVLVGAGIARLAGVAATIATLAVLVILHEILVNLVPLTRGPRAFYGIPVVLSLPWAVGVAIAAIFIAKLFRESPGGIQLRASGDDPVAAQAMGVNVYRQRLIAWVLSSVVVGAGGVVYVLFIGTIAPKAFYLDLTFLTIAMLILGGMRSVSGAITGTIVVGVGIEVARGLESGPRILGVDLPEMFGLTGFFLGAVIVLSLAFRSSGLMGNDEWEDHCRQVIRYLKERKESTE